MTLLEILKEKLTECRRAGKKVEMGVLQVVLGEAAQAAARSGTAPSDEAVEKLIRKTILGNEETLAILEQKGLAGSDNHAKLTTENAFLQALLPEPLSVEEVLAALDDVADAVQAARNDGQATGVAMKHLKGMKLRVLGDDVAAAVKKLRS